MLYYHVYSKELEAVPLLFPTPDLPRVPEKTARSLMLCSLLLRYAHLVSGIQAYCCHNLFGPHLFQSQSQLICPGYCNCSVLLSSA